MTNQTNAGITAEELNQAQSAIRERVSAYQCEVKKGEVTYTFVFDCPYCKYYKAIQTLNQNIFMSCRCGYVFEVKFT